MRFIIGIIVLIILFLAICFGCRPMKTSVSTITTSDTSTNYKQGEIKALADSIQTILKEGFANDMKIGKVYKYFDSLRRAEISMIKDSLGNVTLQAKCKETIYNYTYPEHTIHTKEIIKETVEIPCKKEHGIPLWIKLLIGSLGLSNLGLIFSLIFKR